MGNEISKNSLMFARYDGKTPRVIEDRKGEMVPFFIDKCGIPVYVTNDKKLVSLIISRNASKYKLYRTKPFYMKVTDVATGSSKWELSVPWNYRKETYEAGTDHENNEKQYKSRVMWYEDRDGNEAIEPTTEFLTGKKEECDSTSNVKLEIIKAKDEGDKLKEIIAGLTKTVDALKAQNIALSEQVKELAQVKACDKNDDTQEESKRSPGRPPLNKTPKFTIG